MKTIILVVSCLAFIVLSQPEPPIWPDQFEQDFTEDQDYAFIHLKTQGKFFYDFTNRRYRVDRENGKGDRYCGSVYKLQSTPCSHIVSEGKRYLYFPAKNDCCYCCDDVHGCGVLRPDWAKDAQFIETFTDSHGRQLNKWNKRGGQDNFIYQTSDTKIITEIEQKPNDIQYFIEDTFYQGIRDPSVFDLPTQCTVSKTCTYLSICTPLRD